MSNAEDALLESQLTRTVEFLQNEIRRIEQEQASIQKLHEQRIARCEKCEEDFEVRIRCLQDSVTTFKTWSGLASGAAAILAIVALLRTALGF